MSDIRSATVATAADLAGLIIYGEKPSGLAPLRRIPSNLFTDPISAAASGFIRYATIATMNADTTSPNGSLAIVYLNNGVSDDPLNGVYQKVTGGWELASWYGALALQAVQPVATQIQNDADRVAAAATDAAASASAAAASLTEIRDEQLAAELFFSTIAEGVAQTPVGQIFFSNEGGTPKWYERTATTPFYVEIANFLTGPTVIVARAGTKAARNADYICDGVADHVQISGAIAFVEALGGGIVDVATGVYLVDVPVLGGNNVHLRGQKGATIRASATYVTSSSPVATGTVTAIGKTNFDVSGLIIDNRTNNKGGNGIELRPEGGVLFNGTPCTHCDIIGNEVRCQKSHTYSIWSMRARHIRILNNFIDGGYTTGETMLATTQQEGIEVYGGHDVLIEGNRLIGVGGSSINLIGLTHTVAAPMSEIKVLGNHIETTARAIEISVTSHVAGRMGGMEGSIIQHNTGTDIKVYGFNLQFLDDANNGDPIIFRDNSIEFNSFEMATSGQGASSYACFIRNQRATTGQIASDGNSISHNRFLGSLNTDAGGRGYFARMAGFSFRRNVVRSPVQASGNSRGFLLQGCDNFNFDENTLDGARIFAIEAQGCTNGSISRNTIRNWNQRAVGDQSIVLNQAGATPCSDLVIVDNNFRCVSVAGIDRLLDIGNTATRITHSGNRWAGTGYTGPTFRYAGTNPMNEGFIFASRAVTLTDGATITPDFSLGSNFEVTLGGNRTLANPTGTQPGQSGEIRVNQDATGSRTLAYGSNWRWEGGVKTLSTAANAIDVIRYVVGNDGLILARLRKGFAA